jgi:hypothetical protein
MGLGTVFPYVLPDLVPGQHPDHIRTEQKGEEQGRQSGINGPQGDIAEDIEEGDLLMQGE